MPARTTSARFAPGPSGTACRRTSAGWSTTSTSGSSRCCSSAPQPLESSVSPTASAVSPGEVLSLALDGEHDEIAALRDHPGEHGLADQRRARRDDDLRDPRAAADRARPASCVERRTARPAFARAAEVRVIVRAFAFGKQPLAEEDDDRDRAGDERDADEGELEEPTGRPRLVRGLGDDHVDRRAVSASSEPA